ncbi:MAG: flagellar basal body protein [Alphaproteobacteria bacterium]|nr:flagellar basal body protein [Alphaproteobacteria bacterium]
MDLNNLAFFNIANQEMKYLTERQKVLAENIANANTPDYIAKDLVKPTFTDELKSTVAMTVTNEKHMALPKSRGTSNVYTPTPVNALTIDGNGVVLEDQLNEASKTKGDYNRVITIYNNYKNMLKVAGSKVSG